MASDWRYPCPCVVAPVCPPPEGSNGGGTFESLPCGQYSTGGGGLGGGSGAGGKGGGWIDWDQGGGSSDTDVGGGGMLYSSGGVGGKGTEGITIPPGPPPLPNTLDSFPRDPRDTQGVIEATNPDYRIYDKEYNYEIVEDNTRLDLLTEEVENNSFLDPTNIFNPSILRTLSDVLQNKGRGGVPFNGVTLGAILYGNIFNVNNNISTLLEQIQNANIVSIDLDSILERGIKRAAIDGNIDNYSQGFFQKIIDDSKVFFPTGTPYPTDQSTQKRLGYSMLLQNRLSLDPLAYTNGVHQRNVRLNYLPPTDIDLCFTVKTRSGKDTGIRVSDSNTIEVVQQDGTNATITEQNEFYPIIKQDGNNATVALASKRNEAWFVPTVKKGITGSMWESTGGFSYTITASAAWATGTESVEVSGGGSSIPEGMLYSFIPSSITKIPNYNGELVTTEVLYKLAWQSGDSDSTFNDVVSKYSGPRASVYINPTNPFIDVMLTPSGDGNKYLKVTFTDINVPLDGIYPRQLLTDFMIFAADTPKYDPYYGTPSNLLGYIEGTAVQRTIEVILNPFGETQRENYVGTVKSPTGKGIDNKKDEWAFVYNKLFSDGDKIKTLSKTTRDNFTSQKSPLGTLLTTVSDIDTNYNLSEVGGGKTLPQGDLLSFLTLPQIVKVLQETYSEVVSRVWDGTYNSIKINSVKISDGVKTKLTSANLKVGGTDLDNLRIQKIIPQIIPYFKSKYSNLF